MMMMMKMRSGNICSNLFFFFFLLLLVISTSCNGQACFESWTCFNGNTAGPVTDTDSCQQACSTCEGGGEWRCPDLKFDAVNSAYQCQCYQVDSDSSSCTSSDTRRVVCTDPEFDSDSGASSGGAAGCFSADSMVWVQNKGEVTMSQLQVGDLVLVDLKDERYEPVYSFGHKQEHQQEMFYHIYTRMASNNNSPHKTTSSATSPPLTMTGNHLIYVLNKDDDHKVVMVRADALKVGDMVIKHDGQPISITKIIKAMKRGLYMPLTASGTIVVNAILASSYVSIQKDVPNVVNDSKFFFPFVSSSSSEATILHWWLSPYRMLCLGVVSPSFCSSSSSSSNSYDREKDKGEGWKTRNDLEEEEEEGILTWLQVGRTLAEYANQQGFFIRVFLLGIPIFFLFGMLNLMEMVLGGPAVAPLYIFLLSILFCRTSMVTKVRHKTKKEY